MENNVENQVNEINVKKIKKTNAENIKKCKITHREKYLCDENKLNLWYINK